MPRLSPDRLRVDVRRVADQEHPPVAELPGQPGVVVDEPGAQVRPAPVGGPIGDVDAEHTADAGA